MNTAFTRSGVAATLRLVGVEELSFTEQASGVNTLPLFESNAAARSRRDALGADLVHLFADDLAR